MDHSSIIEKVTRLTQPILDELGLELVDLEYRQHGREWFLRLFVDKEGGVTLDDCAEFSREVSMILDVEEVIPVAYRLEVSSPGLDRPLKKPSDFERFKGELVKIKAKELLDPDGRGHRRKTFVGQLLGLEDGLVRIEQTDRKGGVISLPLDELEQVHLEPEF